MKIKAYDKYRNQHIVIEIYDDEIDIDSTSSMYSSGQIRMNFCVDKEYYKKNPNEPGGEDPRPKRWSDLIDLEIIK